jgi:hypothetical protein
MPLVTYVNDIDAAVALALAVQGATIEQPVSVCDTRGVIAI